MANDYRILDERDKNSFQAGNKLNVTEIGNKVTYEHIGNPPDRLPLQEQILEYGKSFDITVPSVYDSTGHVKSETTYSFVMPEKDNTSGSLTINNFGADSPILIDKQNGNITYSHNVFYQTPNNPETVSLNYGQTFSFSALSDTDGYGHANEKTTYTFQMPAAPSGPTADTSGFLTTSNFEAGNLINVATDTQNKTVTYSHQGVTVDNDSDIPLSLNYGNTVNFTVFSATDGCGHVNKKANVNLTMPNKAKITTFDINKTQVSATYNYNTKIVSEQTIEKSDKYWIVISPNLNGYRHEATNSTSGEIISVLRVIALGSSTFFTKVGTSTFYMPLLLMNIKQGDNDGDNTAELINPLKIETVISESDVDCKISITIYCTNNYNPLSNFIDNIMVIPY